MGWQATRWPAVPDDYERLKQTILAAVAASDIVVVNAGSSAGSEDYTARAVADLGQLVVHGVAVRPGHPVVLGVVRQKPVVGIPGYPVSAALTCELFIKPLIEHKLGLPPSTRPKIDRAHQSKGAVADRRGRIPARPAGSRGHEDGGDAHPTRRRSHHVARTR